MQQSMHQTLLVNDMFVRKFSLTSISPARGFYGVVVCCVQCHSQADNLKELFEQRNLQEIQQR